MSKKKIKFLKMIKEKIIIGDGAMGTMIQDRSSDSLDTPEKVMLEEPEIIKDIHQEYLASGSKLIESNTFGANPIKLKKAGLADKVEEINTAAVKAARDAAGDLIVAGSVGPTGKMMEPHGDLSFEKAEECFKEQTAYLFEAGVDVIIIETMTDLKETRAALLAAKQFDLPVIAQMSYTESGLSLTGTPPEVTAVVLESMGADVIGVNCVAGLKEALPLVAAMSRVTTLPLSVFPNAGLPYNKDGKTVFPESPQDFVEKMESLFKYNVRVIGGCCGTTPEFIPEIKKVVSDFNASLTSKQLESKDENILRLSSNHKILDIGNGKQIKIIGEKLNPTGRDDLKKALREKKWDYLRKLAKKQVVSGAELLDVNIGISGIDQKTVMSNLVQKLQLEVDVPLVLDSNDPEVLESGLKEYTGKALINSVNGDEEVMESIFPLAKKYGAAVIGLTLDEKGIPNTVEGRMKIAGRIINRAEEYGISRENIVIDTLVLTAGSSQEKVLVAVDTLRKVKEELGAATTLGVSNISHGLPARELINEVFLVMALGAGLDMPILDPFNEDNYDLIRAANLLTARDKDGHEFIKWYSSSQNKDEMSSADGVDEDKEKVQQEKDIIEIIKKGVIEGNQDNIIKQLKKALNDYKAQEIVDLALIPGIEKVGDLYDRGTYFLPQLLRSAETVQDGFEFLKGYLEKDGAESKKKTKILLATVKGDIHDIGKNIVQVIFSNHGFEVLDLGANIDSDLIVSKALEEDVDFVGLSSLMTTTMGEMKVVIDKLKDNDYSGAVVIGGAVTSPEYADEIGADIYAEDALDGVRKIKNYLNI